MMPDKSQLSCVLNTRGDDVTTLGDEKTSRRLTDLRIPVLDDGWSGKRLEPQVFFCGDT